MWFTLARALQAKDTGNKLFQEGICQCVLCFKVISEVYRFDACICKVALLRVIFWVVQDYMASHLMYWLQIKWLQLTSIKLSRIQNLTSHLTGSCSSDRQDRGQRKAGKRGRAW
jgi:hypothetical protein